MFTKRTAAGAVVLVMPSSSSPQAPASTQKFPEIPGVPGVATLVGYGVEEKDPCLRFQSSSFLGILCFDRLDQ